MSSATKRKLVQQECESHLPIAENEEVVQIIEGKGNYLHLVENAAKDHQFLVSMPPKFRKNIWVKRGDYVVITLISEGEKVRGEISRVVMKDYRKYLVQNSQWPFDE